MKQGLIFTLTFCLLLALLTLPALAESEPIMKNGRTLANGTPVVIKTGPDARVNMYLATDTEYGDPIFTNIREYIIYAGWEDGDHIGDTSLTIIDGNL